MARHNPRAPSELLFSVFALLVFTIAVHAVYVTVIRPKAAVVLGRSSMLNSTESAISRIDISKDQKGRRTL